MLLLEALGSEPVEDLIEVSIVLHLGTLIAVIVFYRREIWRLLGADRRVVPMLIVGTIPAVIFGLLLKKGLSAEELILENPLVAGLMFPVTAAALLWVSRRIRAKLITRSSPGKSRSLSAACKPSLCCLVFRGAVLRSPPVWVSA